MSMNVDPLVIGRVIGDVVDMFRPSMVMGVYFENKHITNGQTIKPSLATDPPRIIFNGLPHQLYTLVMVDPDAPTPSEPTMREWVHWILTDIPGGRQVTHGNVIVPYAPPRPPIGIHRYILVLYQQKAALGATVEPPDSRCKFSTRDFALRYELGIPAAVVYFNAQREPTGRKRR